MKNAHLAAQNVCDELRQKLEAAEADKQSQILKLSTEIDDLNRTKSILEERLIELIRYDNQPLVKLSKCQMRGGVFFFFQSFFDIMKVE